MFAIYAVYCAEEWEDVHILCTFDTKELAANFFCLNYQEFSSASIRCNVKFEIDEYVPPTHNPNTFKEAMLQYAN